MRLQGDELRQSWENGRTRAEADPMEGSLGLPLCILVFGSMLAATSLGPKGTVWPAPVSGLQD